MQELKMKKIKQAREKIGWRNGQRLDEMDSCISGANCNIGMFNEDLIRRLILRIKVISESKIEIQFKHGIVMVQEVTFYDN